MTFGNDNTYTGGTLVTGTLRLGAGGSAGSIVTGSAVLNNGVVEFNRNDSHVFSSTVPGRRRYRVGSGTVSLGGSNLYTGGTTVYSGGTLLVYSSFGNLALNISAASRRAFPSAAVRSPSPTS